MLCIIAAMEKEMRMIENSISDARREKAGAVEVTRGRLGKCEVAVAVCGIGKVAAAVTAQSLIMQYAPAAIINTGVGGALSSELSICSMTCATDVVEHDMDTSAIGDPIGMISGINIVHIPTDKQLTERLLDTIRSLDLPAFSGCIASGDQFIADRAKKNWIKDTFGAVMCDMESGAVGHTAYLSGIPAGIIRAVSDTADDRSEMDYPTFAAIAADACAKVVIEFASRYEY